MNSARFPRRPFTQAWCIWTALLCLATVADAATTNSTANDGVTLYVSKLGDDSDGSSWSKAFKTIQAALGAVPHDRGGNRIFIRPDTYM